MSSNELESTTVYRVFAVNVSSIIISTIIFLPVFVANSASK